MNSVTDLKKISYHYLTKQFAFDFIGIVPGLVTGEMFKQMYYLKLFRYVNINKLFEQIKFVLEKIHGVLSFFNKKVVDNLLVIAKCIFSLLYMIHIMACFWLFLGHNFDEGWIHTDSEFNKIGDEYYVAYPAAVYFIISTFTTVGYGDFSPHETFEIFLVMVLELIGLAFFSYIMGTLSSIQSQKSAYTIIAKKKKEFEEFLLKVSRSRPSDLPHELFSSSLFNVGTNYEYNVRFVFYLFSFFEELPPKLKKILVVYHLKEFYIHFKNFFWNKDLGFQADDKFITNFLINTDLHVYLPGKTIIERGEQLDHVYLIAVGEVHVLNHKQGDVISILPTY